MTMKSPKEIDIQVIDNNIIINSGFTIDNRPTAAFDLDYTIIKTKSGKVFAIDKDDWVYLYDNTVSFLRKLSKTHNIVIFSNQGGLKNQIKKDVFMNKIVTIIKDMSIPIKVYVSIGNDYFRKPFTGLWKLYKSSSIDKSSIDNQNDYYCGDAAGRKNDFSDTDLMFAHNIGINFYIPEQLFLNKKETIKYKIPDYLTKYNGITDKIVLPNIDKLLILMCGYQGSGKSTVSNSFKISLASNDIQGTKVKCKKYIIQQLKKGKNVVIDNTNHTKSSRKDYIELAKEYDFHSVIVYINNDINFCYYMNQLRHELSEGKSKLIPKIAYYTLRKHFEIPSKNECDTFIQFSNKINSKTLKYMFPSL